MSNKFFIGIMILILPFLTACSLDQEVLISSRVVFCGSDAEINEERLSKIWYIEESMCDFLSGESFESEEAAKAAYGTKVSFKQEATEQDAEVTTYSKYPGDQISLGSKNLTIESVGYDEVEFDINGSSQVIPVSDNRSYENLDIYVSFGCGETYRTDFEIAETLCCEDEDWEGGEGEGEGEEEYVTEEDEMVRQMKGQTREDLKAEGRSGYKGVILPKNVAQERPSIDFALMPFTATPNNMCCGCMQVYKKMKKWSAYVDRQVRTEVINKLSEMNKDISEFDDADFGVVERDEGAMKFALNEVNYNDLFKDYFDDEKRIKKGYWINPDYVVEGTIEFTCCPHSEWVVVTFHAEIINAKTEKRVEKTSYSPAQCFDLVYTPDLLMLEADKFAGLVAEMIENRFTR